MRLFLKHLLNSVKKRPLQPVILIFTLLLATVVCSATLSIGEYLDVETTLKQTVKYGNADISVGINSASESRFMFTKDVKKVLGGDASVAGVYELPLFYGDDNAVFGMATDFKEINEVFNLQFVAYGKITEATVKDVALVSSSFAKRFGLALGDSVRLKVLGYEKDFTIQGISNTPFIASYDVMLDISGVMKLLAKDSLFVASLGEDFKPCNTLYIDLNEGLNATQIVDKLSTVNGLEDKTFTVLEDKALKESNLDVLMLAVYVMIVLTAVLCGAVVFCCFYILSSERSQENAVFNAVGAKPWRLNLLTFFEIFCYWVVGFGLGTACSIPMTGLIANFVKFSFIQPYFSVGACLKSGALLLAVALGTALLFILTGKPRKRQKTTKVPYILVLFALFVITYILSFIVDKDVLFIVSAVCSGCYIAFLFCFTPVLFRAVAERVNLALSRRARKLGAVKAPSFNYAVKNVATVKVLQNTFRLAVLLIAMLFSIILVMGSTQTTFETGKNIFSGDYAVLNAGDTCKEKLEQIDSAEGVYSVFYSVGEQANGVVGQIVGYSDKGAMGDEFGVKNLPKGNGAVISAGHAEMLGLSVGDNFKVKMGEEILALKLSEIAKINQNTIIIDCQHFGIPYNMIMVKGKEGVSKAQLKQEVATALALEFATIMEVEDIIEQKFAIASVYLSSGSIIIPFAVIFALIGILDNLLESYRARRDEFALYKSAGMSACSVKRLKGFELLSVGLFSVIVGAVSLAITMLIIDRLMIAFGYKLLLFLANVA